jgi:putative methionine-R-sulfoxide reductase with GAF domain
VNNEVKVLIDIDAPILNRFHEEDKELLEEIAEVLKELFYE